MPRAGKNKEDAPPRNPLGRGMPDPEPVVEQIPFTTPFGETFVILRTDERDAYDPPPEGEGRAKKAKAKKKATKKAGRKRQRG